MTFDQFLRIVRARWLLAAGIFLTIVLVTVVATLIWPKSYRASASVMVETRPDPVSAVGSMLGMTTTSMVATQLDIITSPRVAIGVVQMMGLTRSEEMRSKWESDTGGKGNFESWVADLISKNLTVRPSRESNVIEIQYESPQPAFAAALANAYARAYIESSTQLRVTPARQYTEFFEERAKLARDKLERAQNALVEAQKAKNIIATDERLDIENQRLLELSQQVLALKAIKVESSGRSAQANARPDQVSEVLNNSVVASLKSQMAIQEAQLNQLSERFGPMHPQVLELTASIETLRSRINNEINRVARSVGSNADVNSTRVREAVAAYDEQRAKVLRMKQERSELAVLERELDSAQRVYDAIQLRLSQTSLESNNSQAGVSLLHAATEPAKHSSPSMTLNLGLSIVMGMLLGLIAVLGIELMDRRVRSSFDIVDTVELPVLGVLPGLSSAKKGIRWLGQRGASALPGAAATGLIKRAEQH